MWPHAPDQMKDMHRHVVFCPNFSIKANELPTKFFFASITGF